jgi:coenzyme F420-dependent glucose-6-phosphate dehydrogenase
MVELGYTLSSEEHGPRELVRYARRAEQAGLSFLSISDHFHPWTDSQGHSPFVWSVIGGVATATNRIALGTGVTCPIMRIHPAIVAQAAATSAAMMPGRFFLGLGTGEALNEHITGEHWPPIDVRLEMLEEAVDIIRGMWSGELFSYQGAYFTVENARIYTLPDQPPPIVVASTGAKSAQLAARVGDGFWNTKPDEETLRAFLDAGGGGPRYGQVTVCWGEDEEKARQLAAEVWPNAGFVGQLSQELALPSYFEAAVEKVPSEELTAGMPCGPDPAKHLEAIRAYVDAGYDHVYIHQIGPDQNGFLDFYHREILPALL